jgi:hypothetical protein
MSALEQAIRAEGFCFRWAYHGNTLQDLKLGYDRFLEVIRFGC